MALAQSLRPATLSVVTALEDRRGEGSPLGSSSSIDSPDAALVFARARSLWPRLDARALRRSNGDPERIARLVGRRSGLDGETIVAMLRRGQNRRDAGR